MLLVICHERAQRTRRKYTKLSETPKTYYILSCELKASYNADNEVTPSRKHLLSNMLDGQTVIC